MSLSGSESLPMPLLNVSLPSPTVMLRGHMATTYTVTPAVKAKSDQNVTLSPVEPFTGSVVSSSTHTQMAIATKYMAVIFFAVLLRFTLKVCSMYVVFLLSMGLSYKDNHYIAFMIPVWHNKG